MLGFTTVNASTFLLINKNMPLTNKEKQAALRKRRAKLGLKRCEFSLTESEKLKVDALLKRIRKGT